MKTIVQNFEITGIATMLMHCGQTADPLNKFARAIKRASGKRAKTDEDLMELSELEWWAGLYLAGECEIHDTKVIPGDDARLVIPAHVLDSCIREGARKSKLGKQASAGCIVMADGEFSHDGPKDLVELSQTDRFVARHLVKVGGSKVARTRPRFPQWTIRFSCEIDPTVLEPQQVLDSLSDAGKLIGIGDWRPGAPHGGNFGRFTVEAV